MRYLNKIIFINSAHIRYAEIMLDGNVHFTGTQGTGKSTLLRALLFFYNADKTHLGIKQGQLSFDQFYFEHANSYILYEVQREIGPYTILVTRSQGTTMFRFIDAPYNRDWIINESGEALSEWTKIRQNITKDATIDISPLFGCMNYRDIIFGNYHERGNKFAKYAIVESSRYQNIPRSIQNVFLNSKLDAEFVKKTIIESMSESETEEAIKLSVYRDQLARFERLYDDIELWFKKEKNGDVIVQRQAQQVISSYRAMLAYEQQIRRSIHELNYAVQQAREQLPVAQEEIKETEKLILDEKNRRKEVETNFQKDKSTLDQNLGVKNNKLKEIRDKWKNYAQIGIEDMLRLHESMPKLQSERAQQQAILEALTKQFDSIEAKYKLLFGTLDNNFQDFKNRQNERLNYVRNEMQKQREVFEKERRAQLEAAEGQYNASREEIEQRIEGLQTDQKNIELKIQELRTWQPYAKEKEAVQAELHQLDIEEKEAGATIIAKEQEIARLRAEAQSEVNKIETKHKIQDEQLRTKQQQLQDELNNINSLLARYKGSLYEWLSKSELPWEVTIGKVVDEERVLYAQGLSPVLASKDDSTLFGVQLDLSQVESTHRSPDDYRKRAKELESQIEAIKKQLSDLLLAKEENIAKISDQLSDKIKPLQQEAAYFRVRLEQIPQLRRNKKTDLATLERKEKEEREAKIEEKQTELNEVILKHSQAKNELSAKRAIWEKAKNQINATFESKARELRKPLDELQTTQKEELKAEEARYAQQKRKYEEDRDAELKGEGADTAAIKKQEEHIRDIDGQLKKIEDQRNLVIGYLKDKEELFDKEDTLKQEKAAIEEKIQNLRGQYEEKTRRINVRLSELQDKWNKQDAKIKTWQDGLEQYRQEIEVAHLLSEMYLQDEKSVQTTKTCQQVLAELRGSITDKEEKLKELKSRVRLFNNNFTPDNIFHFNINPYEDRHFTDIAISLSEFIEKNKIEEYRSRTSEHYQSILQAVSREVGKLMAHQSEIDKVIREINRDYEDNKFAEVIKSIELRSEPSDDTIMRLLYKIKTFTEENDFNLGAANLFSNGNNDEINRKVVDYLRRFMQLLQKDPSKQQLTLSDTFNLQFRIKENDQDTNWVERINNVGSDGTDILVKAMINIMLINVFKKKAARNKDQEFIIHCMLDEIGKLHSNNVRGILHFATKRNIFLINSSPESMNAYDYKYTYMLEKDQKSMTKIYRLLKHESNE